MAVQGLNRLNNYPNAPTPTPERATTVVETVPERSEARSFGQHTLRFKRNMEEMMHINKYANKKVGSALDKLDRATQKLMQSNAKSTQYLYSSNSPFSSHPGRH